MHEMSLCEGVLRILEENAGARGYRRVRKVWLEIGDLAGVDPDAMRFAFAAVSGGTLADSASLEIVAVPGKAWCVDCAAEVAVNERFDACPACGGYGLRLTGGDELRVKELEVE